MQREHKQYVVHKSTGNIWPAGKTILGLCSAYNHATNPALFLSDREHDQARAYARAIKNRIAKLGYKIGINYHEMNNGSYWPVKA